MKTLSLSNAPLIKLHIPDFKHVSIVLVGAGGTGSHLASGLVALQQTLSDGGVALNATIIDKDIVEPKNVGRQLFSIADLGKPKAQVIAERLNAAYGCKFGASARAIDALDTFIGDPAKDTLNMVIGAVDNPAARQIIHRAVTKASGKLWWLDCGNENHSGQVSVGNITDANHMMRTIALGMIDRLPAPTLMYPDLIKTPSQKRARAPRSCAEATAAGEQSLMVNRVVAAYALQLLYTFLVERNPKWFALNFDLNWGGTKAYIIDVPTLSEATMLKDDQLVVKGKK
jgi:PRTRC genetic system ThiF family protein